MSNSVDTTGALIDHHLMMVGRLVNNAAFCDLILFSAFKVISGCNDKIASAIYFASEALSSKKNIITRILNALEDAAEKEIVERIISAAEKSQNQRNELSHALLKISGPDNRLLRTNPRFPDREKPVTGLYLDSLLKTSGQAHLDALLAFQELCQKRGISSTISSE